MSEEIITNDAQRKLVPGFGGRISAALVWDGTDEVRVPAAMGVPRADQMQGTARERLTEIALRVCYDSMGTGRSSEKCHEHIQSVRHFSVHEHAAFTVEVDAPLSSFASEYLNKPSLWVRRGESGYRVTCNLRHAEEWGGGSVVGDDLRTIGHALAPAIVLRPGVVKSKSVRVVEPETDEEKWVTLYLTGSRGWSHELVRHGDWTAISQRSTRYVDESESEWVMHPLLTAFQGESPVVKAADARTTILRFASQLPALLEMGADQAGRTVRAIVKDMHDYASFWTEATQPSMAAQEARIAYQAIVGHLEPWLISRGVDKQTARKQARGAARGMLGNALETEVIFSASVAQFRHMLTMRAADAADGEIRLGFAEGVLPCLRQSRYADRFADLELVPASDGIGRSLKGGGHK